MYVQFCFGGMRSFWACNQSRSLGDPYLGFTTPPFLRNGVIVCIQYLSPAQTAYTRCMYSQHLSFHSQTDRHSQCGLAPHFWHLPSLARIIPWRVVPSSTQILKKKPPLLLLRFHLLLLLHFMSPLVPFSPGPFILHRCFFFLLLLLFFSFPKRRESLLPPTKNTPSYFFPRHNAIYHE